MTRQGGGIKKKIVADRIYFQIVFLKVLEIDLFDECKQRQFLEFLFGIDGAVQLLGFQN